jgi:hypothetical protein
LHIGTDRHRHRHHHRHGRHHHDSYHHYGRECRTVTVRERLPDGTRVTRKRERC